MTDIALEVFEIQSLLDEVVAWVQKNKLGMSKEDAKRIFHRYRTNRERPAEETAPGPSGEGPEGSSTPRPTVAATPTVQMERQAQQISQILDYMEQNTERLGKIEDDIDYIKERVDSILKRL